MALKIGKNDSFERAYMANFRATAARFGEFVEYERDRAGRDIGLHFVSQNADGGEIVAPSLVWFQMKGIQKETFSKDDFDECEQLSISLDVGHLRFWYIAPETTYLALYVEAVDKFFVLNIKKHITEKYGDEILKLNQKSLTVHVSKKSELDEQAFYLIKQRHSVKAWKDKIAKGEEFASIFFRDAELIHRISTASKRKVIIKFIMRKYGSKTRTEAYFIEATNDDEDDDLVIREHWQSMMPDDLSRSFPYLEFNPFENENEYTEGEYFDGQDEWEWPPHELPNGKLVVPEGVFEMVEYRMLVTLNDIGIAWAQTLNVMRAAGFIEFNETEASMVSVAPWHNRDI